MNKLPTYSQHDNLEKQQPLRLFAAVCSGVKHLLLAVVLLNLPLNLALALPEDRDEPLNIVSDEATYDQAKETGTYTGNVVMTQGHLEIKADQATFYLVEGELDYIVATGKLVKIKDLPKEDEPWVYGEGKSLHYYPNRDLLELRTDAKVTQAEDIVTADKIDYNLETRKINAYRNDQKQIHFTIKTKKD